jgi:type I restriction enzyme M protein
MSNRISQQQLESYLWGAAVLLRGTIDAGDYKQFIFPLLFYKRLCDVFDEETEAALAESGGDLEFASYPENHRFQIPREAHWNYARQATSNVGMAIRSAMRAIEKANPDTLYGIFGDAQWTNKERLSDAMLRDLMEHFSTLDLSIANLPEDELGQGYEYLIKKFADDSGHTAAEFYTNRTVVHLMTEILEPQPGESVYDPTCGSGGMLLSCIAHLRRQGQEWRNVRLYGQERNLMTSSIARMNCFLHGIEDFQIIRGDTLSDPKFVEGDRLKRFDLVLANPPYSIKQWDRESFAADPWGRNLFGTPPQGRADYAFWQHIICSLAPSTGRCAILFPHGILFRQEEFEMRQKLIEADLIECVLGLGPNLFYNSPMEACVVVCRSGKSKARKGKILFINAVSEVSRERAQSFLTDDHIKRIVTAYRAFQDEANFARAATIGDVQSNKYSLAIPRYVDGISEDREAVSVCNSLSASVTDYLTSRTAARTALGSALSGIELPGCGKVAEFAGISAPLLKDRTGWVRVRFGDVVENINETEIDPASSGLNRFIGLEHIEPGSFHVRTWGDVSDGTTFKRRCRPGQVLFGKRRAYQRKVAVSEFDAVVSGDIYVLHPKDGRLSTELLPFICVSEPFFRHAVGTSVGSLSPRTNWESLASFEFEIPPLPQQRRIAELTSNADEAIESYSTLAQSLREAADAYREKHFSDGNRFKATPIRNAGRWLSGNTPSRARAEFWNGAFPWVSPKDMKSVLLRDSEEHLSEVGRQNAVVVEPRSILIVVRGMILAHSFPVAITERLVAINQDMKALVPDGVFSAEYLYHWFKWITPRVLSRISDSSHGTKRLAMDDLFEMSVPTPTAPEQQAFVDRVKMLEAAEESARRNIAALKMLYTALNSAYFTNHDL